MAAASRRAARAAATAANSSCACRSRPKCIRPRCPSRWKIPAAFRAAGRRCGWCTDMFPVERGEPMESPLSQRERARRAVPRLWRFGAATLDERTLALTVDGQHVLVEPKPLQILIYL